MADLLKIFKICPLCSGTGEALVTIETPDPADQEAATTIGVCPKCDGVKEIEWGRMEEMEPPGE